MTTENDSRGAEAPWQDRHPLISVGDAALLLGFSAMTIRRKIAARQFPAIRCGSAVKVPRSFVEELLRDTLAGQTVVVEEYAARWFARMTPSAGGVA